MNKLQKNIQQVVAKKALKKIHNIVSEEESRETSEIHWRTFSLVVVILVVILLFVLKFIN